MEKIKSFIKTTFLGGVLILLPIGFLTFLISLAAMSIMKAVRPVADLLTSEFGLPAYVAIPIVILTAIAICFLIGLAAQTKYTSRMFSAIGGRTVIWITDAIENRILKAVPRYGKVKKTITKMMGTHVEESVFSSVALVDLFDNGRRATAFITDTHSDGSYTVFIPAGPNPTSGTIYHLDRQYVHPIDVPVDVALKSVVECGAGSKEIVNALAK